jgi:tetratricopeptide (TPR) repeat protein
MDDATIAIATGWSDAPSAGPNTGQVLAPGSIVGGRYEILRLLGEGGMGAVYEAHDHEVNRMVAFKVIRPELAANPDILHMFRQELILARQVTHRNVIRIYDIGLADGLRFITMQFVGGKDLASLIQEKRRFSPKEAAAIVVEICEGLEAAHKEHVVHRDLKPQNVMIDDQGKVFVMDFGLAHSTATGGSEGALLGTPSYMSPEQARREDIDARSDLFAVGIILYELLTGTLPVEEKNLKEMLRKRGQEQVSAPIVQDPAIPKALNEIVVKCLALDRAARYRSAAEIAYDLQVWLGVVVPSNTKLWKRVSLGFAGLAILLIGYGAVVLERRPPAAQKPVTMLVADFKNQTGETVLDGTLEPLFALAAEGASFISSYNRSQARDIAGQMQPGAISLDEKVARLVAVREGLNVVVSGAIVRTGSDYQVSVKALDAVTGKTIAQSDVKVSRKDELPASISKLVRPIRKALGDNKPVSGQIEAGETFTAASLEAAHDYSLAQDAQLRGKYDAALNYYHAAVGLDPSMGRAYSGMGVIYRNLNNQDEAEKNLKIALSHIGQMSERERFRTRGAYYVTVGSFEKAADEYSTLVKQFPADNAGHANLAICYSYLRNLPLAIEEGRKAIEIYPKNVGQRNNLAGYLLYAGKFQEASKEADEVLKLNPAFERAYVVKALAALASGNTEQAADLYGRAGAASARGASYQAIGLADVAMYEGRAASAVPILEKGIQRDVASGKAEWAAAKYVALANALLALGKKPAAIAAADKAVAATKAEGLTFLAGRAYLEAGQEAKARAITQSLSKRLANEPQAYGLLLEGELALTRGQVREAIKAMQDAQKLLDTWIGRFDLGRAFLAGQAYAEADSELDACARRRGESTALFVDALPTYAYFPPVHYYLGVAQQGLGSPTSAASFEQFLKIKTKSQRDPLVPDARRRTGK